jgi:hypothetical protein
MWFSDPLADVDPWLSAAIDWDRSIAFREHVWDLGLGVAEACIARHHRWFRICQSLEFVSLTNPSDVWS